MLNEHLFSVDKFNEPVHLKNEEAVHIFLYRLLVMTPGTLRTHPSMGIGLVQNYRYEDAETALTRLEKDIQNQVHTYMPQITITDVKLTVNEDKELLIEIVADDMAYLFKTDKTQNTIIPLSDLRGE